MMNEISKYEKEPEFEKYILPFAPELCDFIKEKRKFITYRFGNKYDYLEIGDKIKIQDCDTKEIIGDAKIVNKQKTTFKDLPLEIEGHKKYPNKESQRDTFSNYYAYINRTIKDDDLFLTLEFKM
ncbi:hypothetical protein D4R87_01900 [bacterium]|nr:MAG: hypothetical protein D4R87_01900 [bacterium]